ncbi:MAG: AraC family transcriptional regulator [Ferruginibacter sp.]
MKLFIKNMKGQDCKKWLAALLLELGIVHDDEIRLGEIALPAMIPQPQFMQLKSRLEENGMIIIYERKQILTEQVKYLVHEMLSGDNKPEENYSHYISKRLFLNYTYLANVFSETEGITIEHYIIDKKIEKVKQLLLYSDHSISQIADIAHYSSIGHLSNQFRKVTGVTPSEFKKQLQKN